MKWVLVLWLINGAGNLGNTVVADFDDGSACEAARQFLLKNIRLQEPAAKIMGSCVPMSSRFLPHADGPFSSQ